jgi:hypothetical protein
VLNEKRKVRADNEELVGNGIEEFTEIGDEVYFLAILPSSISVRDVITKRTRATIEKTRCSVSFA